MNIASPQQAITRIKGMPSGLSETRDRGGAHRSIEIGACNEPASGEYLLLRELMHRMNNELAATIGFASLSAARSGNDDVKMALAGVIQQVTDSARVYRALQMPVDDGWMDAAAYLRELCQSISRAKLQHRGIELVLIECPLQLNASRCWRLGMIVSELIANASRHAFRDGGGRIQVELISRETSVECIVTDDGSGSENIRPGQGMKIIRSLVAELRGTINHRSGTKGTSAILAFPLSELERTGSEIHPLNFTYVPPKINR
jgi:two-component sensor histidine kinase